MPSKAFPRDYPLNEIHTGDATALLRKLPSESAQLIIADPPYNLGPRFGLEKEWVRDEEWLPWCGEWLEECKRLLTDDGNLFVYGIHHYLCFLQVKLYELGLEYRRQIIWHYENGFSTHRRSLATHYEPILWFSKSNNYYYRDIREPYKSTERLKHKITKNGKVWTPNPEGRMAGDVWRFPTLAGRRFRDEKVAHPTQKPLSLTDRIVQHFSEPGAVVLVPFAGSGTECVCAQANGRQFWGCEIKPEYVNLAQARLQEAEHRPDDDVVLAPTSSEGGQQQLDL
jgi:DNA modification methylase